MFLTFGQVLVSVLAIAVAFPFIFYPERTIHTLRKKIYQYEVTFGLYMLTPTEKFILNTFLILTISLITLGSTIYLPGHIRTVSSRVFYYYYGHFHYPSYSWSSSVSSINSAVQNALGNNPGEKVMNVTERVKEGVTEIAKGVMAAATAGATAASAVEEVGEKVVDGIVGDDLVGGE